MDCVLAWVLVYYKKYIPFSKDWGADMKRKNMAIGIVILALGAIALSSIIFFAVSVWRTEPKLFETGKDSIGKKLYGQVTDADLDNKYPATPEEIMDMYLNILRLQYGKIVVDDDLMRELVSTQRKLFSADLLAANTEDAQYEELVRATTKLYENKIILSQANRSGVVFPPSQPELCYFTVRQFNSGYGSTMWEYYLQKDAGGNWKIHSWTMTAENGGE